MLDQPRRSRRAALALATAAAGAVAAPLLAGCDVDDLPSPRGLRAGGEPSADEGVLAEAAADVAATVALVVALRDRHPVLRGPLGDLDRMHAAHAEALGSGQRESAGAPRTGGPRAALALLRRREVSHQRRLADLAVRAESGQLAQLLASMSAGVAQHVVALRVGALPAGPVR